MASLNSAACRKETTNNASDVSADVEGFGIIDADTLYTQAETTDARQDNRLTFGQFLLQQIL